MDILQIQQVVHWGSNPSEDKAKPTVTNDPWRKSTTGEPRQRTRTEHSGRVQQQVKFKTTSTKFKSISTKFQEHATNKDVRLWSSAAGVFHMALPSFSWPLGSYILGSSLYLSSSYLQHVQIKCNKFQEHPKNRAVKNCQQVELQNHDNCENCCIHRPMSPHVSNCMQVTSNYLQLKTVDIKSKNSEMNITWTDITRHEESKTVATVKNLQNQCTASAR